MMVPVRDAVATLGTQQQANRTELTHIMDSIQRKLMFQHMEQTVFHEGVGIEVVMVVHQVEKLTVVSDNRNAPLATLVSNGSVIEKRIDWLLNK